jgi:hypothetical protein
MRQSCPEIHGTLIAELPTNHAQLPGVPERNHEGNQMLKLVLPFVMACNIGFAAPMLYTFTGHATGTGPSNDMNVFDGDFAEYRFLVDQDLPGFQTTNGVATYYTREYYADYLGGGPYTTLSIDWQQSWNYGGDGFYSGKIQIVGSVDLPNTYSFIEIFSYDYDQWIVGNTYSGYMQSRGPNNDYREIFSELILRDVSPAQSVPEPASILLFVVGAVGLGFHGKSLRNRIRARKMISSFG